MLMRGCLPPTFTGTETHFAAASPRFNVEPAPDAVVNPDGAAESIGYLLNDQKSDCVIVSILRIHQRQMPGFVPTDAMAGELFNHFGAPADGLDPNAVLTEWRDNGLPYLGKIPGYFVVDLANGTEIVQAIWRAKALMVCSLLPTEADQVFPGAWEAPMTALPPNGGHAYVADGYDQRQSDVKLSRITWGSYLWGGVDLAFVNAYQMAPKSGFAVVPASMPDLARMLEEIEEQAA
ncbi:MAG: hypothetical protein KGL39_07500 [Patescibacteria group bacterium]|nr:hypothetical protein [Patescibacteria group bacterium]